MLRPAGLIFDLDGTLLDTEPLYAQAVQKVLDPFGHEYTLELIRQVMGGDSRVSAQTIIDHYSLPFTVDEYLAEREVHLEELFPNALVMPGADTFISNAAKINLPLGIATSSHRHLYDMKMGHRSWRKHFHATVCGDHPELKRGKPEPDIFLLCAAELGVDPGQCIAFEDSRNGLLAAQAAGMRVIAITSPYVSAGALDGAERIIEHYEELAACLEEWA